MGNMEDPLAVFFNSLERTKEFSKVSLVLPAHGHPFNNLVERADDIIEHHVDRTFPAPFLSLRTSRDLSVPRQFRRTIPMGLLRETWFWVRRNEEPG